jgi:DNA replication protein DnaC
MGVSTITSSLTINPDWISSIPESFRNISFEDCKDIPKKLVEDALHFMQKDLSLFFYGKWGSGKTTLAFALMHWYMQQGSKIQYGSLWPAYITGKSFYSKLLQASKSFEGDSYEIEKWSTKPDLIFIDDIDKISATEHFKMQLFEIINNRMINNFQTLITSNLQPDDMSEIFDGALVSRMNDQTKWKCIKFPPKDLRKLKVLEYT